MVMPSKRIRYRFDKATVEAIAEAYATGTSAEALATNFGIGRKSVFILVADSGREIDRIRRRVRFTPVERTKIVELYRQGLTQVEITKQFGRGPSAIWHVLNTVICRYPEPALPAEQ
jgi:uncharacterized protein (DUF433 family)